MSEIKESSNWSIVPQLEDGDLLTAGDGGVVNAQAKALADRTLFLKEEIEKLIHNGSSLNESDKEVLPRIDETTSGKILISDGAIPSWGNLSFSRVWVSPVGYLPIKNTVTIVQHGLKLDVNKVRADIRLKCIVPEEGYAIGDYCWIWGSDGYSAQTPIISENTLEFKTGMGVALWGLRKDNGRQFNANVENWRYVFRIWY